MKKSAILVLFIFLVSTAVFAEAPVAEQQTDIQEEEIVETDLSQNIGQQGIHDLAKGDVDRRLNDLQRKINDLERQIYRIDDRLDDLESNFRDVERRLGR